MRSAFPVVLHRAVGAVALAAAWIGAPAALAGQSNGDEASASSTERRDLSGTPSIAIPRLTGPIELDGVVDEAAWEEITPFPMTMFSPTYEGAITEATEVRAGHDDQYLYISGRLFDSEPDKIRTNTLYRDLYSGDDLLAIVIDSYNDYETAVWFVVNPAGARNDRTVSNDADFSGGMPMNSDWNSYWDVETTQDERGWFVEFRIPFSTLGFQVVDDGVTMGFITYRYIPRKNERQLFPGIDPRWGGLGFAKPSQAQRVTMQDVHASKPIYVTPYALGGGLQTPVLNPAGSGWTVDRDPTREFGGDLRFSPTSNLSLDVTVNTDFAQVEADDQQVNLTRFSLFFPEKRQFFQERSSTFQFSTGGFTDRLFHSRRIGLDGGQAVRIYGGARAVGRLGGMDFGFLDMQTASQDGRSSENMGVLRLSQQVLNPFSSVGGMVTSRMGSNGEDNIAIGLDSDLRLVGDEYLTVKWAQTFDEAIEEESALESGSFLARWTRRKDDGFSYTGTFIRVGDDYLPRLGFQLRDDFTLYGGRAQYKWFHDAESPLRAVSVGLNTQHFYRNSDDSAESRSIAPELHAEWKGGAQVRITATSSFESVLQPFTVSDVAIGAEEYWFHDVSARLELPRSGLFRGDFTATAGSFYGGDRIGFAVNPSVTASKHLEVGAGYEVNQLDFPLLGASTTAHLARLKLQVALDTRVSLSTFAQYSNVSDLTSFNARFRYHFSEGTDLWVVYNEGLNTDRANGLDPRLPLSAGRTLMVKYSHALIF